MQNKVVVKGKVDKHPTNNKKFKIKSEKSQESDLDIEILGDGEYEIEKLSTDGLPAAMNDGSRIRWFNNFYIKKNGQHINERFLITIPEIEKGSQLVIYDGNGNPYYYTGDIVKNTFELTDGDPAVGRTP